ncbi:autophagy-related protein 16-1-like [Heteronotia binoei]|uniref:autophagy-related protein 16-1-like n=1 Tax=Heteronotia binoei TaxID=13085 RepID=UPI00292CBEAA|nr:autophagy-related protein 16-1-like [Heteronotia binoei]
MRRAAWREHVLEALERREGREGRLRGLLERHEKLQDRLETLLRGAAAGTEQGLEVLELRRERQELHQRLAFLTETLGRTEGESREQQARTQRLAQDLAALRHQHQGLQCQAWELSQEAEGLRGELDCVRGLLHRAQQQRQELEARWVREKALEAERLNWALEQEEKYQRKVRRLREKLQRVRAGALQMGHTMPAREASSSASWEEPERRAVTMGQAIPPNMSSPAGWVRSPPSSTGTDV